MNLLLIIFVCALATCALIATDRREWALGRWLTKPVASAAFVTLAIERGAVASAYGVTVLVALLLCLLGDVLLIPDRVGPSFLAGLVSFLLGHVVFGVAFVILGVSWPITLVAAAVLAVPALLILRWLSAHLSGPMRVAVPVYILAITAMVALSMGTAIPTHSWLIAVGTVCFFLSDIAVARNRFVQAHWHNRLLGLPLYYGATVMLALTV